MALVAREIEFGVSACEVNRFGTAVYGVDLCGTTTHGVDGESACVAEHIEYALALAVRFQQLAVFALVNEESRLLSFEPVDVELQTVFRSHVCFVTTYEETVFLMEVCLVG